MCVFVCVWGGGRGGNMPKSFILEFDRALECIISNLFIFL